MWNVCLLVWFSPAMGVRQPLNFLTRLDFLSFFSLFLMPELNSYFHATTELPITPLLWHVRALLTRAAFTPVTLRTSCAALSHSGAPPPPPQKKTKNTTSQTSFDMDNRGKEWGLVRNSCSSSNGHSRAATLSFMVCFHKPIGDIMEATPMPYTAFGNYQN